ncbi:MAG: glycosyltransferase family 4 protein, partial [Desulfocapsa sp.]|nr:glycosyltransferase family 4 protein [Desulfocapsa sp.]
MSNDHTILLTVPCLKDQGGVASFYNGVFPHFPHGKVVSLEIGGTKNSGTLLHPLVDQFRFRSAVKRMKPSLIHLNPSLGFKSFIRDGLFAWQAKQLGYPFLVFWHGWDKSFEAIVEKKYLGFFKRTFGQAAGFIVLASEFERKLREWGVTAPVYQETTNVEESLLDGIDVQEKWSESTHLSQIKILFLARLERNKGVFETVQAFKFLIDKKFPVCLTIAGDGVIRQELEDYTRGLGLTSQQVHFTGDIRGKEKIQAFAEHHIYCFPTFYGEGLPTSVLEAMAFAMPVVTRPVGGLADIVEDGKMGELVQ